MNGYTYSEEAFAQRAGHLIDRIEMELGPALEYVDSVVNPEVRREASNAARMVADHLERFANRLNPRMEPYRKQGL